MPETDDLRFRSGRFRTARFPGVVGGGLDTTSNQPAAQQQATPQSTGFRNTPVPANRPADDGDPDAPNDTSHQATPFEVGLMGAAFSLAGLPAVGLPLTLARGINSLSGPAEVGSPDSTTPAHSLGAGPPGSGDDTGSGPSAGDPDSASPASDVGAGTAGSSAGDDTGPGGGGPGGGDCVMTTALNDMGDWSDSQKRTAVGWCRRTHHDGSRRGRAWVNGYHRWGSVMAWLMRRSKLLRKTIRPMMNAFTGQATGRKRTVFGFVIKSFVVDPLSYCFGCLSVISRRQRRI